MGLFLQGLERFRRETCSVICHCQDELIFGCGKRKADVTALGVVIHAVLDEVIHGAGNQSGVAFQHGLFGVRRNLNFNAVVIGDPRIQSVGNIGAQQLGQAHRFLVKGLHFIFQLRYQVQILYQLLDLDTLLAHDLCLFPNFPACGSVFGDAAGIPHNHGERCADVVGDAADPIRPRRILPAQHGRCLADAACNFR